MSQTWTAHLTNCKTVADLKTLYRNLAKKYHPDIGGDTTIMQQINDLYHQLLKAFDGSVSDDENGKPHTYWYDQDVEQAIIDMIATLFAANLSDGTEIWLIGTWIWILNTVKELDRDKLKALSCRWHRKRRCWYWHGSAYKHFSSSASLNSLAQTYGCKQFSDDTKKSTAKHALV